MSRKKQNKLPFQLKNKIKWQYQLCFINYLNDIPEIKDELKSLTPLCEQLFGKMTSARNFDESESIGDFAEKIVHQYLYKRTRIYQSLTSFLLKDICEQFVPVWNVFQEYEQKLLSIVESKIANNYDYWATLYSNETAISTKEINKAHLVSWVQALSRNALIEDDETYKVITDYQKKMIKKIYEFRDSFNSILEKYCLEKYWLALAVFFAVWDGSGKIKHTYYYSENVSGKALIEIKKRLNEPSFQSEIPIGDDNQSFIMPLIIPLAQPFQ